MSDDQGGTREPGNFDVRAGRDAIVAGRDATVINVFGGKPLAPESSAYMAQGVLGQADVGWSLAHDPEFKRHWDPRSRGVALATEEGDRFRGRDAALSRIRSWLADRAPMRRIVAVTGAPGVGKSAVLSRLVVSGGSDTVAAQSPDGHLNAASDVHCAVHVRGKTSLEVAREITRAAGGSPISQVQDLVVSFLTALESKQRPVFNVVIDALDEARSSLETRSIVLDILLPIAESSHGLDVHVLVGTRQRDEEGSILRLLAEAADIIDLDEAAYFELGDLVSYTMAMLQPRGAAWSGTYSDASVALPVAERIADLAAPNFLVGGLMARSHGLYDQEPVSPNEIVFTGSVEDAFRRYLQRIPAVDGVSAAEIFTGLALAEVPGLNYELWRVAIKVLTERDIGLASLRKFSRTAAANFLIEESDAKTGRTYTLYHEALNESLISWRNDLGSGREQDERLLASALVKLGQTGGWEHAPDYLRQSLSAHASRGGVIDELLSEPEFLLFADLGRLLTQISGLRSEIAIARTRLLRLTPEAFGDAPMNRLAMFSVTEAIEGLGRDFISLRSRQPPYRGLWAVRGLASEQTAVLKGHTGWVNSVAAAEFGSQPVLVSGDNRGVVNIWDLNTRAVLKRLTTYFTAHLRDMCWVRTRKWLIAVETGRERPERVIYWDLSLLDQGAASSEYISFGDVKDFHLASCLSVWEGPSRAAIVVGNSEGRLGAWDLDTGNQIVEFSSAGRAVDSVCTAELDGRPVVVSGTRDGWLSLWDLLDGRLIRRWKAHRGSIYALCPFPDNGRLMLASGGADKKLRVWDFMAIPAVSESPAFPDIVHKILRYRSYGRDFIAILGGNNLYFLDPQTAEIVSEYRDIGVYRAFGGACVIVDSGQELVATADINGSVHLWEPSIAAAEPETQPATVVACIGADVKSDLPFLFSMSGKVVELRDMRSGSVRRSFATGIEKSHAITAAGDHIVIATGSRVAVLARNSLQSVLEIEHGSGVTAVTARSIRGRSYMASGDADGMIAIFDLDGRELIGQIDGDRGSIVSASLLDVDGKLCVAAAVHADKSIRLWRVDTASIMRRLSRPEGRVHSLCVTRLDDVEVLAGADSRGMLFFWPPKGRAWSRWTGQRNWANAICEVTVDSRRHLAVAGHDRVIRIFDPRDESPKAVVPLPYEAASLVSPSPGKLAVLANGGILGLEFTGEWSNLPASVIDRPQPIPYF